MYGRRILLGVSGSIASYKAAFLVRLLKKSGAEVKVIMTPDSTHFITPLTLSTLSQNEVYTAFEKVDGGLWNNHVDLGNWADIMLIAPATASSLSKMAQGLSDNLLVATYLSATCPVFFAPAMDLDMWAHRATQENCQRLISFGNHQIGPGKGELASGLSGDGRMAEPEEILEVLTRFFRHGNTFQGKSILITAGPTQEALDPVRYISNHSTGKMGYALAEKLAEAGAMVHLVSGPTGLKVHHPKIKLIPIRSAEEMYQCSMEIFPKVDIGILTAAVADYKPIHPKTTKIKSSSETMIVELEKNKDIAFELGKIKNKGQLLGGFALETDNELENARGKLARKNLDFIVLNSMQDSGATFGHDTNKISILDTTGSILEYELKSKQKVAEDILQYIQGKLGFEK